jgi:hypothetical protein
MTILDEVGHGNTPLSKRYVVMRATHPPLGELPRLPFGCWIDLTLVGFVALSYQYYAEVVMVLWWDDCGPGVQLAWTYPWHLAAVVTAVVGFDAVPLGTGLAVAAFLACVVSLSNEGIESGFRHTPLGLARR